MKRMSYIGVGKGARWLLHVADGCGGLKLMQPQNKRCKLYENRELTNIYLYRSLGARAQYVPDRGRPEPCLTT